MSTIGLLLSCAGRKVSCLEERVKQMEQHKENGLNLLREEVERCVLACVF